MLHIRRWLWLSHEAVVAWYPFCSLGQYHLSTELSYVLHHQLGVTQEDSPPSPLAWPGQMVPEPWLEQGGSWLLVWSCLCPDRVCCAKVHCDTEQGSSKGHSVILLWDRWGPGAPRALFNSFVKRLVFVLHNIPQGPTSVCIINLKCFPSSNYSNPPVGKQEPAGQRFLVLATQSWSVTV